jgi:hypothetical protein
MRRAMIAVSLYALWLTPTPASAAESIGRLFFTPAQRAQLDNARSQKNRATLASEQQEGAPAAEVITYGGMVRRSDGKSTVWINNRSLHDREATGGVAVGPVRSDGALTIQLPQSGRNVELKVGQSMEVLSGTIEEPYARRLTTPKPAAKPAAGATSPASETVKTETAPQRPQRKRDAEEDAARSPTPETNTPGASSQPDTGSRNY